MLRIGTRGSRLALEQTRRVRQLIPEPTVQEIIETSGDRFGDVPLGATENVGFFTKEIENRLLAGEIDMAVHSTKDLPTTLAEGLAFGAVLKRDDPKDVLLVNAEFHDSANVFQLAAGSTVGASSARRIALLERYAPEVKPMPIRGNVTTRIKKSIEGQYDAIILARAGLERLGLDVSPLLAFDLNPLLWPPAPGQGAIAVEIRAKDPEIAQYMRHLDHETTRRRVFAERSLLAVLGGGCHLPLGAFAYEESGACEMVVSAPFSGSCRIRCFRAPTLEQVRKIAEEWLENAEGSAEELNAQWLCMPAKPWR